MLRRALVVLALLSGSAQAAEIEVPAEPGAAQAVFERGALSDGDRVILAPGAHGVLLIDARRFDPPVTVSGAGAVLDRLILRNSAGLIVEDLAVIPRDLDGPGEAMVEVQGGEAVHLHNLTVATVRDSAGWDAAAWRRWARHGIVLSGKDIRVTDSWIHNVRHGLLSLADGAWVENTRVEHFSGDGMRGLGSNSTFLGNTIRECVDVDDNHDDGFQSWSIDLLGTPGGGVVRNVRLENNLIENGTHPMACTLQGIGMFDGFYEGWVIRGNRIVVNNWHGITVMGARNVRIEGNIVVDAQPGEPGPPWIAVTAHKDGRLSDDTVVAGNVTQPWRGGPDSPFKPTQPGVTWLDNHSVQTAEEALRGP